jgi:hypothetical protein
VVANTQYSGLRFNTTNLSNAKVWSNTFYNTGLSSAGKSGSYGVISDDWNLPAGSVSFVNNIFYASAGSHFIGGSTSFSGKESTWANNLWFNGTDAVPSFAAASVNANPLFVSAGSDYHLVTTSPAIGTGSSTTSSMVTNDLYGTTRSGSADIGAVTHK